ncbi:MAG TPA: NAD(P)H-quinone oxidoreductase [Vulgatibacter sp.]|nr:NAD(P)H-quinone oxidoreductase [Vulgatibacter sp.]
MRTARAVQIVDPSHLRIAEIFVRDPGPGEILVAVAAAGLNRADVLQRKGLYPAPPGAPADVPGLEYAGTVEAVGEGVLSHRPGDRVMGIVGGGAMATHLVVHERETIPAPEGLGLEEAAAIPEVFFTAYDALFVQGGLRSFDVVLIHAVGSGVGTAALQLARHAGCRVLGTSRSADKLQRAARFGLEREDAIVPADGRFAERVRERCGGVDLILDLVGAAYAAENLAALATKGRVVVVGLLGGASANLPLGLLLQRRASLVGTVLRSRPLEEKAHLAQRFAKEVNHLFTAGLLRPVIDAVLPMERIEEAHGRLERNETFGKIVLAW